MTDRLGADIQIAACSSDITAEAFANIFFDTWYCENGCPWEIISDRDKLFISKFWKALMKLIGIHHKLSTSYHPEMDGASECTNKTIVQCLRYHVECNQKGWAKALPKVRFNIMNMVNASTGISPFVLKTGRSPRLLPPLPREGDANNATLSATAILEAIENNVHSTRDSLLAAKISQAHHVNMDRAPDPTYEVGDCVMLVTAHCRREYMQGKDGRVAKFMPRFDGPYDIVEAYPESSTYKLLLPTSVKHHPMFHVSQLHAHIPNNPILFPGCELERPGPIITEEGVTEYFIERILDEQPCRRGKQYLVCWRGYGAESDLWLPQTELLEMDALHEWTTQQGEC